MHERTGDIARLVRDLAQSDVPADFVHFIFHVREHMGCFPLLKEVMNKGGDGGARGVRNGIQRNVHFP